MSDAKKDLRSIEGHYNYYGIPAYILKQKNGAYASGLYDCAEGVFKAGGSAKKILWDGMKIGQSEAKRLIEKYSKTNNAPAEDEGTPDWILLPEEASFFLDQSDKIRSEGPDLLKNMTPLPDKDQGPQKREGENLF